MNTLIGRCVLLLVAGSLVAAPMLGQSKATGQVANVVQFQDVTSAVLGNVVVTDPGGPENGNWGWIAVGDWDGTGWPGLALNTWPGTHLFSNRQGKFVEVPAPRINGEFYARIGIWCDTDGTGQENLLLGGVGEIFGTWLDHWYRVQTTGAMTEITPAAVAGANPPIQIRAMTCADIDRDGRMDVFEAADMLPPGYSSDPNVQTRLWMNKGKNVFTNEVAARAPRVETGGNPYVIACADISTPLLGFPSCIAAGNNFNEWHLSLGDGTLTLGTFGHSGHFLYLDAYLGDAVFADFDGVGRTGIAVGDTTINDSTQVPIIVGCNDGNWSPSIGNEGGIVGCWKPPLPGNTPDWVHHSVGRIVVADFDNSGAPSILETFSGNAFQFYDPNRLWMNSGSTPGAPNFVEMAQSAGIANACPAYVDGQDISSAAAIDYDMDGRIDLIVTCSVRYAPGSYKVFRNVTPDNNAWVGFILRSPGTLGTWVTVTACGHVQRQQLTARTGWWHQDDRHVHFGLGLCESSVQVTIAWPNGATINYSVPPRHYYVANGSKGRLAVFK